MEEQIAVQQNPPVPTQSIADAAVQFVNLLSQILRDSDEARLLAAGQTSRGLVEMLLKCACEVALHRCVDPQELFISTTAICDDWFLKVVAARVAEADGEFESALRYLDEALSQKPTDLYAQSLWLGTKRKLQGSDADIDAAKDDDLHRRFCTRPFLRAELDQENAWMCCPAWLPIPMGSSALPMEQNWNGEVAQELRKSIIDGSFRYCSRTLCPWIAQQKLPLRAEMNLDEFAVVMSKPQYVNLSHDRTCNLSCPSCREVRFTADAAQQQSLAYFYNGPFAKYLSDAKLVGFNGSGDPFSSRHGREVLKDLVARDLQIDLQTNGVLFDEKAWNDLELEGHIHNVWVSLDAATEETYRILRRGGDWVRVQSNLRFMADMRKQGRMQRLGIDCVMQNGNLGEALALIRLGKEIGVDCVRFNMIRNWGTLSSDEFRVAFVGSPLHPRYEEFVAILANPLFSDPIVDPGNVWQYSPTDFHPASTGKNLVLGT